MRTRRLRRPQPFLQLRLRHRVSQLRLSPVQTLSKRLTPLTSRVSKCSLSSIQHRSTVPLTRCYRRIERQAVSMIIRNALKDTYHRLISQPSNQIPFWILAGFLPTFLISRLIVDSTPNLHLTVHGTHVHHLTYGIIVLALTGFVSLVWPRVPRRTLAAVYGIGLALAFDEFGMWLHLTSNYNIDTSEDVMVGILVFLVFFVYGVGIIRSIFRYVHPGKRQ